MSKNKIIYRLAIMTMVFLTIASCDNKEKHRYIYINNNSTHAIYYRFSFAYPDTTLKESDPNNYKLISGEQHVTSAASFAYNSTMQIFILDSYVVENEPWDTIVTHYQILKRYQFTEQFLESQNWTISYP
jgi:hypothetical protein